VEREEAMQWERTGRRRSVDAPYDPIAAADIARARAYSRLDDTPLPAPPLVEQEEWRCGEVVEWRDA
jgi:hypothetical protein